MPTRLVDYLAKALAGDCKTPEASFFVLAEYNAFTSSAVQEKVT